MTFQEIDDLIKFVLSNPHYQQFLKEIPNPTHTIINKSIIIGMSSKNTFLIFKDLDLSFSEILSLPDNLTVHGDLDLSFSDIVSLPNNLSVNGSLILSGTNIKYIPNNLYVRDDLYVTDTNIDTTILFPYGMTPYEMVLINN